MGSDILGRTVDDEPEAVFVLVAEEEFGVEFEFVWVVVVADCLVELAVPVPAPSLAEEVRLTECDWSSELFPFWDFWAMVSTNSGTRPLIAVSECSQRCMQRP